MAQHAGENHGWAEIVTTPGPSRSKALWILRQAGLVETLPGVGVFVAEKPPAS